MTREEIEQAIKNGESVWYIVNNELAEIDLSCNFHKIEDSELLTWYDKYSKDYYTHRKKLEDLYKSQAEAEHYLHHTNITRTEQLPFLTWEEFLEERHLSFIGKNEIEYMLCIFGDKIDLAEHRACSSFVIKEWHATEANFYKAYDECVRLFKGEE